MRIAGVTLTLVVAATMSACGASDKEGAATPRSTSGVAGAGISIKDFTFNPTPLSVGIDTVVEVANEDTTAHTMTADDGSFDTGNIPAGASASVTAPNAGTVGYHCTIHTYMKGSLTVR